MGHTFEPDGNPVIDCHQLMKTCGKGCTRVAALRGVDLES